MKLEEGLMSILGYVYAITVAVIVVDVTALVGYLNIHVGMSSSHLHLT